MAVDSPFVSRCCALFVVLSFLLMASAALAQVPLTEISHDDFTNTTSMHETEVEPASYAFGPTIVTVFQVGRFTDGGASDIGFATSSDHGTTWTHGRLPGITKLEGTGTYDRASDTAVTYNTKFKVWLAESLALLESGGAHGQAVLVSSSKDGITWNNPVLVSDAGRNGFYDKPWIGCDNTSTSPFYGNCYMAWDDFSLGDQLEMSTSTDGGATWSAKKTTSGNNFGTGGIPLVQPNGTVIVPAGDQFLSSIIAFRSTDGGNTWSSPKTVSTISEHGVAGSMAQASVTLRPIKPLKIENTYLFERLRAQDDAAQFVQSQFPGAGRSILNDHILRSKWNWQFTPQLSARVILQYNALLAGTPGVGSPYTYLPTSRQFNADFLITYLVHPGTAIYVGYNSDLRNLDVFPLTPGSPGFVTNTAHGYINDSRQFFVKVSYLFRF